MKKLLFLTVLWYGTSGISKAQTLVSVTPTPLIGAGVGNCFPFGASQGDYVFFIYQNIPAFTMSPGSLLQFDLGALNDIDIKRNIFITNLNGGPGGTVAGWTQVVFPTQTPLNPKGNTTRGDYELTFTTSNTFTHPATGALAIGFQSTGDPGCEQVLVYTSSSDASGRFAGRAYNYASLPAPGSTIPVLDVNFVGGFIVQSPAVPLPLKLLQFEGFRHNAANRITWRTEAEDAGTSFQLERSSDANKFVRIADVPGIGGHSDYEFMDSASLPSVAYYRLRIMEPGNAVSYSAVISIRNAFANADVSVWPNPAHDQITIRCDDPAFEGQTASIFDIHGREVRRLQLGGTQQVDISGWPAGIYGLRLPDGKVLKVEKL